ncbi:MAG: RecX family transcriptional regulator [Bacteroidetes bacterium]|jgi:regulatory protein|nr:RecX family transcriptional regulator [Bacteroidota bacterium]
MSGNSFKQKNIGVERAWQKIKHYCAYQERNHLEVKEKLYSLGLYKIEVEQLLSQLIEENYLNEERYATSFAGGKFRTKQWGRIKIGYELKQNKISEYCIKKALQSISNEDYNATLKKLFDQKKKTVASEKNIFIKKRKIQSYLLQKGYEPELINQLLNEK